MDGGCVTSPLALSTLALGLHSATRAADTAAKKGTLAACSGVPLLPRFPFCAPSFCFCETEAFTLPVATSLSLFEFSFSVLFIFFPSFSVKGRAVEENCSVTLQDDDDDDKERPTEEDTTTAGRVDGERKEESPVLVVVEESGIGVRLAGVVTGEGGVGCEVGEVKGGEGVPVTGVSSTCGSFIKDLLLSGGACFCEE